MVARVVLVLLVPALLLAGCGGEEEPDGGGQTVTVEGFSFAPATIEVSAGEAVLWDNRDSTEHTATGAEGAFDLSLPAGASAEHAFTDPGTYPYACAIHPNMTGEVVVR